MMDALKTLIRNRESEKLVTFISNNPEILDRLDENGSSGSLLIAYSGIEAAVKKAKELKHSFTFHEAIVYGKLDLVKDFLTNDAALVNTYSKDGFTPISLAAFFDQTEIAILLLQHGADPTGHATNPSKVNALHSAVAKNNLELCRLFIQFGVNVNAPQTQNITPLHSAAHLGNLKIVQLLVEHGALIDYKMDSGKTAIDFANDDGHAEVTKYLEDKLRNSRLH